MEAELGKLCVKFWKSFMGKSFMGTVGKTEMVPT
jgi:hypothetical protein